MLICVCMSFTPLGNLAIYPDLSRVSIDSCDLGQRKIRRSRKSGSFLFTKRVKTCSDTVSAREGKC